MKIACVNGLASKLKKFYSSPDRSIPLFSLFSPHEYCWSIGQYKVSKDTCCSFTRANIHDSEKLGNETGSPTTQARKLVIENKQHSHVT